MGGSEILPDRSEIGDKSFSPTIDRFSLFVLSVLGILAFPEIEEALEPVSYTHLTLPTICSV